MIMRSLIVGLTLVFSSTSFGKEFFTFKGKAYGPSNLPPLVLQQIFEIESERHDNIKKVLDNSLLTIYLEDLAKERKTTVQKLEDEFLTVKEPSEKEMKEWYESNKDRIPYPFDQVKKDISKFLSAETRQKQKQVLLEKIKSEGKFKLFAEAPVAPKFNIKHKSFPYKGGDNAKVTIIEFADYQCPHCAKASKTVSKIAKKYGSKVKIVYMDFPINPSGISRTVAEGAVCADAQKKFWKYHTMAFDNQKTLSKNSPVEFAKRLKLNMDKFKSCLSAKATKEKVVAAQTEGEKVGVRGTPSFYLNGRRVAYPDYAHLTDAIEMELKR